MAGVARPDTPQQRRPFGRISGALVSLVRSFGRLAKPRPYVDAFREVRAIVRANPALTREVVKRDLRGQHAGLVLGRAWGFAQPLLILALYAFVFGVVFRVRIGGTIELPRNYTIYLLAGMVPWLAFIQAMARGATALTDNAPLVKQMVFPVEILPVSRALSACTPLLIGLVFLVGFELVTEGSLPWTAALVPLLVALQLLAMTGVAFALSALGTVVRDVREVIQVVAVLGIFVLPIVYLPDSVPSVFRPLLYANPFSYLVWGYQDALYFGRFEHPYAWVVFGLASPFAFVTGYRLFRKVRPYFGNVL